MFATQRLKETSQGHVNCVGYWELLNGSTSRGGAYGFKFDSLAKMSTVKTTGNKATLMHFLATVLEEDYPDLKDFPDDIEKVIDIAGGKY